MISFTERNRAEEGSGKERPQRPTRGDPQTPSARLSSACPPVMGHLPPFPARAWGPRSPCLARHLHHGKGLSGSARGPTCLGAERALHPGAETRVPQERPSSLPGSFFISVSCRWASYSVPQRPAMANVSVTFGRWIGNERSW